MGQGYVRTFNGSSPHQASSSPPRTQPPCRQLASTSLRCRAQSRPHSGQTPCVQLVSPPPRRGLLRRRRPHRGTAFTLRAKKVLELALSEADQLGTRHIGSGHILLGVLSEDSGLAATIILATGHSLGDLRRDTLTALDKVA